jgi:hypothetical protein
MTNLEQRHHGRLKVPSTHDANPPCLSEDCEHQLLAVSILIFFLRIHLTGACINVDEITGLRITFPFTGMDVFAITAEHY